MGSVFGCDPTAAAWSVMQDPGDEPVWRQLLRLHLDHSDPDVAQQAAAALATPLMVSSSINKEMGVEMRNIATLLCKGILTI